MESPGVPDRAAHRTGAAQRLWRGARMPEGSTRVVAEADRRSVPTRHRRAPTGAGTALRSLPLPSGHRLRGVRRHRVRELPTAVEMGTPAVPPRPPMTPWQRAVQDRPATSVGASRAATATAGDVRPVAPHRYPVPRPGCLPRPVARGPSVPASRTIHATLRSFVGLARGSEAVGLVISRRSAPSLAFAKGGDVGPGQPTRRPRAR